MLLNLWQSHCQDTFVNKLEELLELRRSNPVCSSIRQHIHLMQSNLCKKKKKSDLENYFLKIGYLLFALVAQVIYYLR